MKKARKLIRGLLLIALIGVCFSGMLACDNKEALKAVSSVDYDGSKLTWLDSNGTENFDVTINGKTSTVQGSFMEYDAGKKDFDVTVVAKANGTKNDSAPAKMSFKFIKDVTNITIVDGVASWDAIENAQYKISFNGIERPETIETNSYKGIEPNKSIEIKVRAIKNGTARLKYFSSFNESKTFTLLPSPIIAFDKNTQSVSWQLIDKAEGYSLKCSLNGKVVDNEVFGSDVSLCSDIDFSQVGEYVIELKTTANSANSLYDSAYSAPLTVTKLGAPKEITNLTTDAFNNTTITFSPVSKADGYKVEINAENLELTKNTFNYQFPIVNSESTYKVKIFAKSDNPHILNSDISKPKEVDLTKLAPISVDSIKNQDGFLLWDAVNLATEYGINVSGVDYIAKGERFEIPSMKAGTHSIKLFAKGNGTNVISSDYKKIELKRLDKPTTLAIKNEILTWNASLGCTAYEVYVGTEKINCANASYKIDVQMLAPVTTISVVAKGNGELVIDSEASQIISIARLDTPSNIRITNDSIVWNTVAGAKSYRIKIDGRTDDIMVGTSYQTSNLTAGQHVISIYAQGDKEKTFLSKESTALTVTKLGKTDITADTDGCRFTWKGVPFKENYEVMIDSDTQIVQDAFYAPAFTTGGAKNIKVRALGNSNTTINGDWAELTHTVKTLSKPENSIIKVVKGERTLTITADAILGNASGFYIYVDGIKYEADANNSYEHPLAGASDYAIEVQFKGDGFNYVDSLKSSSKTIKILVAINIDSIMWDITEGLTTINWTAGGNDERYSVTITKTPVSGVAEEPKTMEHTRPTCEIASEGYLSITIKIVVKGDGINSFDSVAVEKTISLVQG